MGERGDFKPLGRPGEGWQRRHLGNLQRQSYRGMPEFPVHRMLRCLILDFYQGND